jgi:hypothetical protein
MAPHRLATHLVEHLIPQNGVLDVVLVLGLPLVALGLSLDGDQRAACAGDLLAANALHQALAAVGAHGHVGECEEDVCAGALLPVLVMFRSLRIEASYVNDDLYCGTRRPNFLGLACSWLGSCFESRKKKINHLFLSDSLSPHNHHYMKTP